MQAFSRRGTKAPALGEEGLPQKVLPFVATHIRGGYVLFGNGCIMFAIGLSELTTANDTLSDCAENVSLSNTFSTL